jgi:hypothetical protein
MKEKIDYTEEEKEMIELEFARKKKQEEIWNPTDDM